MSRGSAVGTEGQQWELRVSCGDRRSAEAGEGQQREQRVSCGNWGSAVGTEPAALPGEGQAVLLGTAEKTPCNSSAPAEIRVW